MTNITVDWITFQFYPSFTASCRTGSGGLQVAYLTPKALATHVWDAFATRKHLLFYSSQPSEGPKLDAAGMLEGKAGGNFGMDEIWLIPH
jgi:hypothetical protein